MRKIFTQVQCLKFTRSHFSVNAKRAVKRAVSLCKLMLVFSLLIFTSRFVNQSHARLFVDMLTFFSKYARAYWQRTGSFAPAILFIRFSSQTSHTCSMSYHHRQFHILTIFIAKLSFSLLSSYRFIVPSPYKVGKSRSTCRNSRVGRQGPLIFTYMSHIFGAYSECSPKYIHCKIETSVLGGRSNVKGAGCSFSLLGV